MSLNWDATQVSGLDWDTMTDDVKEDIGRFAFVLMAIGMGEVSEANYQEVSARIAIYEALNGLIAYTQTTPEGKPVSVYTAEFVKSMIGYDTNVSKVPFGQWATNLMKRHIKA